MSNWCWLSVKLYMENILGNGSKLMEKELYFLLVSQELKIHVKKYIPFCMHMI